MPAEVRDAAAAACPKSMVHGPCGGVGLDGTCEVAPVPCPFVPLTPTRWAGTAPAGPRHAGAEETRALLATRPIVVVDLPAAPLSAASIAACGQVLRGRVDAVLAGDSGEARVQLPPAYRAHLLREAGLRTWTGLTCRDRNRVALEGELAGLADVEVAGVHCVTGDHTATGHRPDARPVFDLDSTALAALARAAGHLVSVAESPVAPPAEQRAARLREKERAGADLCFVNHCGGVEAVAAFAADARRAGVGLGLVACVPIVLDAGSAAVMRSFTTSPMPPGHVEGILAAGPDAGAVRRAGVDAAIGLGRAMLDLGLAGVDLSGGPAPGAELAYAESVAEIAEALLRG